MKEITTIIAAYNAIDKTITQAALATVVRVEGSSYRRTGARMLVQDNGTWVGGISGGCLEGDALKRARMAIFKGSPSLITYDTTQDDSHQIGVGLGCNGIIDVLFTPLNFTDINNPVEVLKKCTEEDRKTHVLLSVIGLDENVSGLNIGDAILYENVGNLAVIKEEELRNEIYEVVNNQLAKGHSAPVDVVSSSARCRLFVELIPPTIRLLILGHQYDVFPLVRLVNEMGWEATVIAPKEKVNVHIRAVVKNVVSMDAFNTIKIDDYTAVVLMSHDYEKDKINLISVLKTDARYVGMLGPRIRSESIWSELSESGFEISEQDQKRIYAPVGLDIGAVSPEEIALSLIAEIRAVFSGRAGQSLRLRAMPIHERI